MPRVETLNQTHPSRNETWIQEVGGLYEGGERWREHISHWIPQHPVEPDEQWEKRKKQALYANHAGPLVDLFAAHLFAELPTVEGLEGDWVEGWVQDVDRQGSTLAQFWSARLIDLLVYQTAYVWVELPPPSSADPPASRLQQERSGALDAWLVGLTPEDVIDWHEDGDGLVWVMVRTRHEDRPDPLGPRTTVWRWTLVDREQITVWEWRSTKDRQVPRGEDYAELVDGFPVEHGFPSIPITRMCLPPGLYAMGKLHDPAIAHLRADNDLRWALWMAAHPLLWIASAFQNKRPILGAGYYLQLSPEDSIGYVEPSGASWELLRQDLDRRLSEMHRVVHQMASSISDEASRTQMSGESKAMDWRATEIVLAALALIVGSWMGDTLTLVAQVRSRLGEVDPVTVGGFDGWQTEDLDTWIKAAAASTEALRLSPTFRRELAKRQVAKAIPDLDDGVSNTIWIEIDTAAVLPQAREALSESGEEGV